MSPFRVSAGQESQLFSYCQCIVKIESPALCVHENVLILTFRTILAQQWQRFAVTTPDLCSGNFKVCDMCKFWWVPPLRIQTCGPVHLLKCPRLNSMCPTFGKHPDADSTVYPQVRL